MVRVMTVFAVLLAIAGGQTERWVYRYHGSADGGGRAYSLVAGADGNVYAAGASTSLVSRFTVISLTPSGGERWVYTYNNPRSSIDWAGSVVVGADGNIYSAGLSNDMGKHFTVISLTPADSERWVYRYPAESWANSVAVGADGNIYAAGLGGDDFIVVSLTPSGGERWAYRYDSAGLSNGEALSLVAGADGNVYAAGWRVDTAPGTDFTVISLTSGGAERWVYRYNGPGNSDDCANSLIAGADGNVYVAGTSTGTGYDFTVISLTPSGSERWVYRYDGPGNSDDYASSLVAGTDGNIYAAGSSTGSDSTYDFTVISLTSGSGIAEVGPLAGNNAFGLAVGTIKNRALAYILKLPKPATVSLSLCDLQGRKLASWQVTVSKGSSQHTRNLPDLGSGVYFLTAEVPGKGLRENRKLIVAQ